MTDKSQLKEPIDYKNTLNLPETEFPMRGDGAKREPEIQKFWYENNIYQKALEKRKSSSKRFLLHDGPPYLSSGNIHIGTALNKILKDIVVKYKTLHGYYSPYVPGYDCHGLPIESAVSKEKKKDSQKEISILEIRKECREFVIKNRKSQEEKFKRLGVLGNWENPYITIDPAFEAKQLELFGKMVEKKFIYRGLKPVYWCSSCQTALAEAEVEYVDNYKSLSVYVAFKIKKLSNEANKLEEFKDLSIVIWTTTPWTLPGNLAICLNPDFDYVVIESKKHGHLLLAEGLLENFKSKIAEDCQILKKLKGCDLENTICKHPFLDRESPVILGDHVTLEAGTGCVHTAPGHGLEDFSVGQKYGLKVLSPVNSKGVLTPEAGSILEGLYVHKAGNQKVIEILSNSGSLILSEDYYHSYPHCWRSKTPIIFRATEQWFCSVKDFRDKAIAAINTVQWIPEIGKNRISTMVQSRTDWCISRQRVWGVPITAFYCNGCNKVHLNKQIIDHISRLVENHLSGTDIWFEKEAKDLLPEGYKCDCGSHDFKKETDIMDVWFDSGSTHYSVVDAREELKGFKDIMYLEGSDQHRGWFQSSLLTSVAIKDKAPYSHVLTHGFVLDESGKKMSKSLGNVVDPEKVISEYGADILRLWVASIDYSSDMRIGQTMIKQLADVYRNIRNTLRFVLSNLYDFDELKASISYDDLKGIDKYALVRLMQIKEEISKAFENYEFYKFYQILQNYCVSDLSGLYFDIVKDRLYTDRGSSRTSVQLVLREILKTLLPIISPVLPHLAEDAWRYLPEGILRKKDDSVLLANLSEEPWLLNPTYLNIEIMKDFEKIITVRQAVFKALEVARSEKKIGKSLEAKSLIIVKDKTLLNILNKYKTELPEICIVSQVNISDNQPVISASLSTNSTDFCEVYIFHADGLKCPRCWKYSKEVGKDPNHLTICKPCADAVECRD